MTSHAGTLGYAPKVIIAPYTPKARLLEKAEPVVPATTEKAESNSVQLAYAPEPITNPEAQKYEKLWSMGAEYREVAPGEILAQEFLKLARPDQDAEIIDFGCGTGRGAINLALFGGLRVTMLDFAANCLDDFVVDTCKSQPERVKFIQHDLTKPVPVTAAYGFCCDVMEHIPPEDVPTVLKNILQASHHIFFCISTADDLKGAMIGEKLHLTVQPIEWWIAEIKKAGGVIHWTQKFSDEACGIYCSSWKDAGYLVQNGKLNVAEELLDANVRANIEAGWNNIRPYNTQPRELIILAGGPTMAGQIDKIRELRAAGAGLVTVNGAYNWAIDQGLVPSTQIVLDGRKFNKRFVEPQVETCVYLMASQVDPETMEGLPHDRTWLWHSGISDENEQLLREKTGEYFPVPGGSTVVLRAIPLLRMLGYTRFHIFGFDSCIMEDGTHHSYDQPENDGQADIPIQVDGRDFRCVPWMVAQASEFRELVQFLGDAVELAVYGDGLIAHMLETGADMAAAEAAKEAEHA